MVKLALTLACGDYDRTAALALGDIEPEGIALNYLRLPVEETFWRMLRYQEFDVAEMSLSSYLIHRSRTTNFVAIPVFPSRCFRHSSIFVYSGSGIKQPADLIGKRVGVPEYQMTAPLWQRALLQHEYDVAASSIQWFQGGLEQPGREEKQALVLPANISLQALGPDQTLSQMLRTGEIDALFSARIPSSFHPQSLMEHDAALPDVQRLFPDFKHVEQEYFRKTGIFPIMHVIVFRSDVIEKNPWIAQSFYKAFCQAKDDLFKRIGETSALHLSLPWLTAELEDTQHLMGTDFWPYGLEANRITLEAATQYAYEQGLTSQKLDVNTLFYPSTLATFKI